MTDATQTPPDDDPWAPVSDGDRPDLPDPVDVGEATDDDAPFAPLPDEPGLDLAIPGFIEEEAPDPWDDAPPPQPLELSAAPANLYLPPPSPAPRLLPEPAPSAVPLPWRTTARLFGPTTASVLCEAAPRLERSRLLVSAWERAEGDASRVQFRLADDGRDVEVDAAPGEIPVVHFGIDVAGVQLELDLEIVADRAGRGLVLGRDALAGRFLVDASADDWPV